MNILDTWQGDAHHEIVVIATAMDMEAEAFLTDMNDVNEEVVAGQTWRVGRWSSVPDLTVCVVTTGIGLVNAASAAARAQVFFGSHLRAYICAGTTGGLGADINVRDVIVGNQFLYSRADATMFGYQPGQVPGMPAVFAGGSVLSEIAQNLPSEIDGHRIRVGQVASSDAFITTATVERIRELFPLALGADMESSAAAQVCALAGVEFLSVRGVSDLCGPKADQEFHIDGRVAAQNSAQITAEVLRRFVA